MKDSLARLDLEDISVDGEGRVAITNPRVAERLKAAAAAKKRKPRPKPKPNTNCGVCNTVDGCGPLNEICTPNSVPNCGCRAIQ